MVSSKWSNPRNGSWTTTPVEGEAVTRTDRLGVARELRESRTCTFLYTNCGRRSPPRCAPIDEVQARLSLVQESFPVRRGRSGGVACSPLHYEGAVGSGANH